MSDTESDLLRAILAELRQVRLAIDRTSLGPLRANPVELASIEPDARMIEIERRLRAVEKLVPKR